MIGLLRSTARPLTCQHLAAQIAERGSIDPLAQECANIAPFAGLPARLNSAERVT